ncbi:hypothetical protein HPB52_004551 [Rhipicephalus sanguineus]|uniref:Uncharacterized protein n=1 Tax=Rhipicephalus sanguineus TaxID=34632 RepID=A0A9D4SWA1_RHISA|nr:hypothetical protein HPB52_004551 [Rhipicephalus sanguineus]
MYSFPTVFQKFCRKVQSSRKNLWYLPSSFWLITKNGGKSRSRKSRKVLVGRGGKPSKEHKSTGEKKDNLGAIVRYFKDKGLSLTTADKEGGFVVMTSAIYQKNARQAIKKNFVKLCADTGCLRSSGFPI